MKSSFQFSPEELTDLVASVLATNGHSAIGGLTIYKDGKPVEFDEARIDASAQIVVRCQPEQSKYDKMMERYFQSVGQFAPLQTPEPEDAGQSQEAS